MARVVRAVVIAGAVVAGGGVLAGGVMGAPRAIPHHHVAACGQRARVALSAVAPPVAAGAVDDARRGTRAPVVHEFRTGAAFDVTLENGDVLLATACRCMLGM